MKDTNPIVHLKSMAWTPFFFFLNILTGDLDFFNTCTKWIKSMEIRRHMETLGLAHLPTHSIVFHFSGLGIIYEKSIWQLICWYVLTVDNTLWIHLSNSLHCACIDVTSTSSVAADERALQPCHLLNLQERSAAVQPRLKGGKNKKNFLLILTETNRQTHWGGGGWQEDVDGLSPVKGRDNVSNREALRSVRGSRKASRKQHPLTQMTNVHWAFPIPLLSARTNA